MGMLIVVLIKQYNTGQSARVYQFCFGVTDSTTISSPNLFSVRVGGARSRDSMHRDASGCRSMRDVVSDSRRLEDAILALVSH